MRNNKPSATVETILPKFLDLDRALAHVPGLESRAKYGFFRDFTKWRHEDRDCSMSRVGLTASALKAISPARADDLFDEAQGALIWPCGSD